MTLLLSLDFKSFEIIVYAKEYYSVRLLQRYRFFFFFFFFLIHPRGRNPIVRQQLHRNATKKLSIAVNSEAIDRREREREREKVKVKVGKEREK